MFGNLRTFKLERLPITELELRFEVIKNNFYVTFVTEKLHYLGQFGRQGDYKCTSLTDVE